MKYIYLALPFVVMLIILVKTSSHWVAEIRKLPRMTQVFAVLFCGFIISYGGSKPVGPTKANLRWLVAERERKRLSDGRAYGEKDVLVGAQAMAGAAADNVDFASGNLQDATNALAGAALDIDEAIGLERWSLRLVPAESIYTNQSLYAETVDISVTNGVADAFVWFNVVPNSEPIMRFHFASGTATNVFYSAIPTSSSFPVTSEKNNKQCYSFFFDVPPILLHPDGTLIAPLDFEREVTIGSPETKEPFDLRGGLAIYEDGKYYLAVTGYRTNSVSGIVYYFDNGRLANPPAKIQEVENENM